jgi:hypothetical protein
MPFLLPAERLHRADGSCSLPTMRVRALTVALVAITLLAGCGSAKPKPNPPGRHYHLDISEIDPPCSSSASGAACAAVSIFASDEPKLSKPQAIERATKLAHRSSLVVLRMACHPMPGGWRCVYAGRP